MKIKGLVFFFLITLSISHAQSVSISNSYNRDYTSLNGQWNYIVDPYENGFYNYRYEPFENQ
ncbi:MAG: hypothetical protein ACN4ES_15335, partial [Cellulophaga baltica]